MYKVEILWGIKWMDTEKSEGAERTERWTKEQKKVIKYTDSKEEAIDELKSAGDDWSEKLWKCIIAFENDTFTTSGRGNRPGIMFTYTVTKAVGASGRHYDGTAIPGYGNEIRIEGKTKSISRSTVELGYKRVQEMGGIVKGPRSLEIPGAGSYLYSLFLRFGMIKKFACDYDGESL